VAFAISFKNHRQIAENRTFPTLVIIAVNTDSEVSRQREERKTRQ